MLEINALVSTDFGQRVGMNNLRRGRIPNSIITETNLMSTLASR